MKYGLSVMLCLVVITARSQVLDIESKRIVTDTNGFAGSVNTSLSLVKYRDMLLNIGGKVHMQYKYNRHFFLVYNDLAFIKSGEESFQNYGLFHLLYNVKINKWLRWEAFGQLSYNELIKLRLRANAGTGPRFKISPLEKFRVYGGVAYMFEYEEIRDDTTINRDHRLNAYISFTIDPKKVFKMISTTYYQPNILYWTDYRISGNVVMLFHITKKLDIKLEYIYSYDSRPMPDIPDFFYTISNGIMYKF